MKKPPIVTSISTAVFSLFLAGCQSVPAPEAILPVPQEKQVNWQDGNLCLCAFRSQYFQ